MHSAVGVHVLDSAHDGAHVHAHLVLGVDAPVAVGAQPAHQLAAGCELRDQVEPRGALVGRVQRDDVRVAQRAQHAELAHLA